MATVLEKFVIALSLDPKPFEEGTARAEEAVDKADKAAQKAQESAKGAEKAYADLGDKWASTLKGVLMNIAAPIAAGAAIFKSITGYASQVAEVAQMTGGYSRQLEEWRVKRAMLSRVTREDIELYRKSREAVVGFQIVMGDLSARIARQFSPAIEWGVEQLERLTKWINANSGNLARFFAIAGTAITAFFLPALVKMGVALAANPITWLVMGLGTLILVIDDLVSYMRGGQSALADFWGIFGTGEELSAALNGILTTLKETFAEFLPVLKSMGGGALVLIGGFSAILVLLRSVIAVSRGTLGAFSALTRGVMSIFSAARGFAVGIPLLLSVLRTSFMTSVQFFATAGGALLRIFSGGIGWLIRVAPMAAALIGKTLAGAFALLGKVALGVLTAITAHPIIAIIVAITAAVIGLFKAWENGGGTLSGMLDYLRDLLADLVGDWGILGDVILGAFDLAAGAVEWLADLILNLPQYASQAVDEIIAWFTGLYADVTGTFDSIRDYLSNAFNSAVERIKGIFSGLWEWIKGLFDFGELIDSALDKVKGIGTGIVEGAKDLLGFGDDEEEAGAHEGETAFNPAVHGAEAVSAVSGPQNVTTDNSVTTVSNDNRVSTVNSQSFTEQPENTGAVSNDNRVTNVTNEGATYQITEQAEPAQPAAPAQPLRPEAREAPEITNNVTVIEGQPQSAQPVQAPAYSNGTAAWAQQYAAQGVPPVPPAQTYNNAYYSSMAQTSNYDNSQRSSSMTQNNHITINSGTSSAQETARAVDSVLTRRSADYGRSVMAVETGTRI